MNRLFRQLIAKPVCALVLVVLLAGSVLKAHGDGDQSAQKPINRVRLPKVVLPSATGSQAGLESLAGKRATVLIFMSTECPISNGYVPTVNQLHKDCQSKGASLVVLNPNEGQSLREIASHKTKYRIDSDVLKDAGGAVAAALGVETCPTACVFDEKRELRYLGRIDDRYQRRGGSALEPRSHDLASALEQILAGKPVEAARTPVVGCPVQRIESDSAAAANPSGVTYSRQIARIVQERCEGCHRAGGVAPFALSNYAQTKLWSADIAAFTANRTMPPWKPVEGHGEFHNKRRMPQDEIDAIAAWVKAGCPLGDEKELPTPVAYREGWTFGAPDVVLEPSAPYLVASDGGDEYRCFVLPTNFPEDKYVAAIEVLPGNRAAVHHVIAFVDTTGASSRLDDEDTKPGYSTSAGFPGFLPAGGLGGWAPGNVPHRLPQGMARVLPKGANVVMQVHYHKTGKSEEDLTRLGIYFAQGKVTRAVRSIPILPWKERLKGMRIPAGESNYEVTAEIDLPHDVLAVGVTPHMHLLGKDMKVEAVRPDGSEARLIYVDHWDFNWQETYQYVQPVDLPKGTRLELVAHFDNSTGNPSNPYSPPKVVGWGPQTNDEMCIAFLETVPREEAKSAADLKLPAPGDGLRALFRQRLGLDKRAPAPK